MEDKISEKFCKGKEFLDCMFTNRNWDCNKDSCPLSKNKTKDVKKHIERIIKAVKTQTIKDVIEELKLKIKEKKATYK